jgi:AsmA family
MKTLAPDIANRRGSLLTKLFVFACALAATFALMWMLLLPSIVTGLIKKRTGFDATVQRLYVNPFTASVYISQLKINNPDTFPQNDFVSVNEFKTAVEPGSVFSDRVVVKDAVFDVAIIAVVKNAQGQTNIDAFKAGVQAASSEGKSPNPKSQPAPEEKKPPKQFLIRHLVVKLDKIIIADYSGAAPKVNEIPVHLNRTFTDVTDLKQISVPILADLGAAGAGKLANNILGLVIPAPILEQLGVVTKDTGGILQGTGQKTKDLFKGMFDSLEEKPKQ